MQCIVTQLDLALLSGQSWLSPILRLLGPAAEQPGTATGICAAACAHQLCIPLPGCGSGVKGWRVPLGPVTPCHHQGLWVVWATHLCPGLCSPNQGKQMSGSHVTNHAALCSQGSLPRWPPGCFSPALSFKVGCWPGSPECLRAIVPGTWAAPLGPAPRVLAAAGRWVTAERAGLCSDLKSVLSSGRDCNIHRLCRAQRRAAPAQRLGGFASLYKLFFSEFPGDVELQLLSEQQQTGAAVITASESVLETPRGNAVSDWEQASFWRGGRPRSL